jgi:hypothetical protein
VYPLLSIWLWLVVVLVAGTQQVIKAVVVVVQVDLELGQVWSLLLEPHIRLQ